MQALKNNYEKFIFGTLLVAFVGSGVYWLSYLQGVNSLADKGANITVAMPNKPLAALEAAEFQATKFIDSEMLNWGILDGKVNDSLFEGRSYMRCVNETCQRWIAFGSPGCPWCKTLQPPRKTEDDDPSPEQDSDLDGIPDDIELAFDFLKPNRIVDGYKDEDGDSFFNRVEYRYFYKQKTESKGQAMADPKLHPPLALHFRLVGVDHDLLPVRLLKVTAFKGEPKEKWDVVLEFRNRGKRDSRLFKIGAVVNGYTIVDAEEKYAKVYDKTLKDEKQVDVSYVVLQKGDAPPITLGYKEYKKTGIVAKLVLETSLQGTKPLGTFRDGDIVKVEDTARQVETYKIQIGDTGMAAILLVDGQPAGTFPINRQKKITVPPEVMLPSAMEESYEYFPGPGVPPELRFIP